ncbi:hypothetical protein A3751_16565 [Oleiphilus sp. HI0080]|nr:hypothetical protein A3751_16565 [Oleiphilus sp. HI0080]
MLTDGLQSTVYFPLLSAHSLCRVLAWRIYAAITPIYDRLIVHIERETGADDDDKRFVRKPVASVFRFKSEGFGDSCLSTSSFSRFDQ